MQMASSQRPSSPQPLYLTDADLARRIVTENTKRLEEACASLAARRKAGCWTYSAEAHNAALEALNLDIKQEDSTARTLA